MFTFQTVSNILRKSSRRKNNKLSSRRLEISEMLFKYKDEIAFVTKQLKDSKFYDNLKNELDNTNYTTSSFKYSTHRSLSHLIKIRITYHETDQGTRYWLNVIETLDNYKK